MRKWEYKKYLLIGGVLFLLVSLPLVFVENMRGALIRSLFFVLRGRGEPSEAQRLEGENHLLRIEVGKLRALLDQKEKVAAFHHEQKRYASPSRRYEEIGYLSGLAAQSVAARVIYRDPSSWSSSCWINVGEETNKALNRVVIQKNSPVILGRSLVGAIDYVGKKQSRVRLITDVALNPSVRAVRGLAQQMALLEHIDPLIRQLHLRSDFTFSDQEKTHVVTLLEKWKEKIGDEKEGKLLAKGILQGAGTPLWRCAAHTLRGIGFNYDFADAEGPARELVTGKANLSDGTQNALAILKTGDLLVTTGMDGVFPPGLRVAEVTKIYPLREGAYTYEIDAVPVVSTLNTLQTVFVIPACGYTLTEE